MTDYKGIDYGMSMTNIDKKTNIRFGIISQSAVPYWFEESEADYGKPSCPDCKNELDESINIRDLDIEEEYYCSTCKKGFNDIDDTLFLDEPLLYYYSQNGYKTFSDIYNDIWITESPYYTYAQFCGPCAPGACHLSSPLETPHPDNKCYCFGHDWFEDEKAPYPVYDCKTGKKV